MTAAGGTKLLEREPELAQLVTSIQKARMDDGSLVVVEGAAGLGKTELLHAALRYARESGMQALHARAAELERGFPFGVVRQLIDPLLAGGNGDGRETLFRGAAALARPIFEEVTDRPADGGDRYAYATLEGLYWLLVNSSAAGGRVLVVDDAHVADSASLRFLAFLVPRLPDLETALIVATEPDEAGRESSFLSEIASAPLALTIRPKPLSLSSVAQLTRSALRHDPEPEFSSACHRATAGNPLLLQCLLEELARQGAKPTSANAPRVHGMGPRDVSRTILLRLARLPPACLALVRAVAVLWDGRPVELRRAALFSELDESGAARAADLLTRIAVFKRAKHLEFTHPIVRESLYCDLAPQERALQHARAAEVLHRTGAPVEEIGPHLLSTDPGDQTWALDALLAAARRSSLDGAPERAVRYLRRAAAERHPRPVRAGLLCELGEAEALVGDPAAIDHLTEAFENAADARTLGRVALALGRLLLLAARPAESVNVYQKAIDRIRSSNGEPVLSLETELLVAARHGVSTRRLVVVERVEALCNDNGSARGSVARQVCGFLALDAALRNEPSSVVTALATQTLDAESSLSDGKADSPLYYSAVAALLLSEQLEAAEQALDAAAQDARARGSVLGLAMASCWRSALHYIHGRLDSAETAARESLQSLGKQQWDFVIPLAISTLLDGLLERGQLEEAASVLQSSRRFGVLTALGGPTHLWLERRGKLRLARRRYDEALQDFLVCGRRQEAWGATNPAYLPWRSACALAYAGKGNGEEAECLAKEELALAQRFGAPRPIGNALRVLGLIGGDGRGLELLAQAVETLEHSASRLELARALIDWGTALRRANKRSDAQTRLARGLELAEACGATVLVERATGELAAIGVRSRPRRATGIDALTASERRVAGMAADGLTNPQIADALVVSLKTIETHLTSAYRKLGVSSRSLLRGVLIAGDKS